MTAGGHEVANECHGSEGSGPCKERNGKEKPWKSNR
jgi:hypothetical protein